MPVGNRLAPARQIRLDADARPAAITGETQACPHIVDYQQRTGLVAQLTCPSCVCWIKVFLVNKGVVFNRRGKNSRQIIARLANSSLQAFGVIIGVEYLMGPVAGHNAVPQGRAPWRSAVISALGENDGLAARMVAGNHHRHCRRIRAVLAEHRPVRMRDQRSHLFCEVDHQTGRARHRVALSISGCP